MMQQQNIITYNAIKKYGLIAIFNRKRLYILYHSNLSISYKIILLGALYLRFIDHKHKEMGALKKMSKKLEISKKFESYLESLGFNKIQIHRAWNKILKLFENTIRYYLVDIEDEDEDEDEDD
jgi:hypothetical protein